MRAQKTGQKRIHEIGVECADDKFTALALLLLLFDGKHQIVHVLHNNSGVLEKDLSVLIERKIFLFPVEQLTPELVFHLLERPAERRLGDIQPFCCAGDAAFLRNGNKALQIFYVHTIAACAGF